MPSGGSPGPPDQPRRKRRSAGRPSSRLTNATFCCVKITIVNAPRKCLPDPAAGRTHRACPRGRDRRNPRGVGRARLLRRQPRRRRRTPRGAQRPRSTDGGAPRRRLFWTRCSSRLTRRLPSPTPARFEAICWSWRGALPRSRPHPPARRWSAPSRVKHREIPRSPPPVDGSGPSGSRSTGRSSSGPRTAEEVDPRVDVAGLLIEALLGPLYFPVAGHGRTSRRRFHRGHRRPRVRGVR